MKNSNTRSRENVVGLIPAAGYSMRLGLIPCSKEIYPIGYHRIEGTREIRPKAVCEYLIESMQSAGVQQIYVVLRKGKWDIPGYLSDGSQFNVDLAYCVMEASAGPVFSLNHAYSFVKDATVAFGFPDIIFKTHDAFQQLLDRRRRTRADVVLGLFPTEETAQDDRIIIDRAGKVRAIAFGKSGPNYPHTWSIAVWGPTFTGFMHEYVASMRKRADGSVRRKPGVVTAEHTVGHVMAAAFHRGLRMDGIVFANGSWIDIGTPSGMMKALKCYGEADGM